MSFNERFFTPKKEPVNSQKLEHLENPKDRIVACIGTFQQFGMPESDEEYFKTMNPEYLTQTNKDVNYCADPEELKKNDFKNGGEQSFVISPIDSESKFSRGFFNCTGIIAVGRNAEGKNISLFSHQDPWYFLSHGKENFLNSISERLENLKNLSKTGTIDAVIIGGNYFSQKNLEKFRVDYKNSIKLLSGIIEEVLDFTPVVLTGPKTDCGSDSVFFDNENRRLYIMRPEVGNETSKDYIYTDMDEAEEGWKRKE